MNEHEKQPENTPPTGELRPSEKEIEGSQIIVYPFGPYEILIRLSQDGQFIEVVELRINKDFLSYSQRISSMGHHNVEQFYDQ